MLIEILSIPSIPMAMVKRYAFTNIGELSCDIDESKGKLCRK